MVQSYVTHIIVAKTEEPNFERLLSDSSLLLPIENCKHLRGNYSLEFLII